MRKTTEVDRRFPQEEGQGQGRPAEQGGVPQPHGEETSPVLSTAGPPYTFLLISGVFRCFIPLCQICANTCLGIVNPLDVKVVGSEKALLKRRVGGGRVDPQDCSSSRPDFGVPLKRGVGGGGVDPRDCSSSPAATCRQVELAAAGSHGYCFE